MRALTFRKKEKLLGLAFIAPALILFLLFMAYPMVYGLLLSFTSNRNAGAALKFNGLANYIRLFTKDSYFQIALTNNLIYALLFTPGVLIVALLVAMLLNSKIRGKTALRTICFFPYLTSMVSVATVWNLILAPSGPLNQLLRMVGISNPPGMAPGSKLGAVFRNYRRHLEKLRLLHDHPAGRSAGDPKISV